MKITNCKTNHMVNPLGYQLGKPVFSYIVEESAGTRQIQARICVAQDESMEQKLVDTGWREDIDSLAYAPELELVPCTRYYWTAAVQSDAGEEAVSDVNWFETGKMDQEWKASWITCEEKKGHPIFRKEILADGKVKRARLYICGLGLYETGINGEKVGEELFTPYSNDYNQWLQYQTYDITDRVQENVVLEVLLGNGWYRGRFGFWIAPEHKGYYSDTLKLIAEVRMEYEDGHESVIGTDESWEVRYSHITDSSVYDGETWDMTLEDEGTTRAILCGETMAPLSERYSTPVKVREKIVPIELIHTPAGEMVLDLGQNLSGIFSLKVSVPAGEKVHLQFGEILQQGNFYRDNLRSAKAEFIYISDGKEREIVPRFTFYGYRYVKVEGIPNLQKEDFTALALYSEFPERGTLTTGNEKVNRLIQNARWGQKGNFIDVPTDCPQRDERMGWTGDAQVFSPTALYFSDSYAFYRKYLHDCWMEQKEHDNMVPNMIPSAGGTIQGCSAVWGDVVCIIPWNLYRFYGDKTILEEQFDSMKAWVDYITTVDGDHHGWRTTFQFGDWLALDHPESRGAEQVMGGTDEGFIADVYYAHSAELVAKAAEVIGKKDEAEKYNALAQKVREGIRGEYYSATGRCCCNTQTAHLLTLHYDLIEEKERAKQALISKFEESNHKLRTGFVGTPLLCNVLSDYGMDDLAYELLLNEEYPGWLYAVNLGATTVWERWNSVLEDGSISGTGMNSLNHYSYGSVVEWMFRHCAGLNPAAEVPGFRKVCFKPSINWKLQKLAAVYQSAAGTYRSAWEVLDKTHIRIEAEVPFGCEAELILPFAKAETYEDRTNPMFAKTENGVCILGPGCYSITYETEKPLYCLFSTNNSIKELMENPKTREIMQTAGAAFSQVPADWHDMTPKQVLGQFGGNSPEAAAMLERLDALLAEVE